MTKPEAKAMIWMDEGVLIQSPGLTDPRVPDRLKEVIASLRGDGLRMVAITRAPTIAARDTLSRAGLLTHMNATMPVFSTTDYEDTLHNKALTIAFQEARESLGTDLKSTIAVVGSVQDVILARAAGLPVIGFAASAAIAFEQVAGIRTDMQYRGAFFTSSAAVDLPEAVRQFKPFKEPKWQPMAAQ